MASNIEMTSTSKKTLLSPQDRPSEKMLHRIAKHVIIDYLYCIAVDIGMNEARFSRLKSDFRDSSEQLIFQVCARDY